MCTNSAQLSQKLLSASCALATLFAAALADVAAVEAFAPPQAVTAALLRAGVCRGRGREREGRRSEERRERERGERE